MLQQMTQMASQMGVIERYSESKQSKVNELVDQVNEASSCSRNDRSIRGTIEIIDSGGSSMELSAANALIASLRVNLTHAQTTTQTRTKDRRGD